MNDAEQPAAGALDGADEIDPQSVIHFADGIPGFPEVRRFVLVSEIDDAAFQLFQSVDQADFALIVTVPWLFFPDYAPELSDVESQHLDIQDQGEAVVLCPVTLDEAANCVHVNLLGPFVINARTRQGRQLVLTESGYPVRARVDLDSF